MLLDNLHLLSIIFFLILGLALLIGGIYRLVNGILEFGKLTEDNFVIFGVHFLFAMASFVLTYLLYTIGA